MASAVIASRNEPNWPQVASSFMGKNPSNNNNHKHNLISPNLNPNPNPNSNLFRGGSSRKGNHTATTAHHQNGGDFVNPSVSDDAASSFSRRPAGWVGESEGGLSHYVTYHISTCSRSDLRELKARLAAELEQIRILSGRIESGELLTHPRGGVVKGSVKEKKVSGTKRGAPFSPMRKESKQRTASSSPLQAPVVTTSFSPVVEEVVPVLVGSEEVMKMCKQLLNKLTRNKFCFWFNKPVDVEGMLLFDYYDIIKNPMDLGTVKSKLNRDAYSNPDEFAADVRLTFNNAMVYNPEGQEVHKYAKDLLSKFEAMFVPIAQRFDAEKQQHRLQVLQEQHVRQANQAQVQPRPALPQVMPMPIPQPQIKPHTQPQRRSVVEQDMYHEKKQFVEKMDTEEVVEVVDDELQGSSWSKIASPERPKKSSNSSKQQQQERQVETAPEHPPAQMVDANREMGRASAPKLPKPKAKEPNKREMTMLEKHRLGTGLQNLPEEKMVHVVQIIRKRNGHLTQDGDEIELDIEAVDTETLWELDRFVTNYKKAASKLKRQVMMPINNGAQIESNMGAGVSERVARKGGGDVGEEDVDIGDEMPMSHFPPVEIEKDDEGQAAASGSSSRSSSSSSGSSSSSDSDSGSSSDSDSDVDDALSRDNGSKNFHKT
ncbi:Transcription factor GTE7-like protein [Drosera capensis]